jgi:hypothetical protein
MFYFLVLVLFGAVKGLLQLNLRNITSFQVGYYAFTIQHTPPGPQQPDPAFRSGLGLNRE